MEFNASFSTRLVRMALSAAALAALAILQNGIATPAAQGQGAEIALALPQPAGSGGRVQVLIELRAEAAAAVFARAIDQAPSVTPGVRQAAAIEGQAQVQRVLGQQQQLASAMAASGIVATEIYRVQKAMNAIAAEVDGSSVAALRRLPGVKAVHILELEYPTTASAVPFIGAPPVWANTLGLPAGATGAGVRIGVIDTGLDYLHADFGGSGLLADYQANDRTVAPDAFFPSAKVVGGFDFAGDNYNGSAGTIAPDADPMDCNGHGTHVAGSAAGNGVNADGTPFAGPYGPGTPFSSLRIGPGSAPQASLYGLRVFGCGGGTNLTVQAIDWATDPNGDSDMSDRLDVINLSLGSALGTLTSTSSIAAENAAALGVIVVAAAGNNGDTYTVNGAPSVSTRAISVAATLDGGVGALTLRVNAPAGIAGFMTTGIAVAFGGQAPAGGITANVVQALDPADAAGPLTTDACSPLTNAAGVAGTIAFVDRGTCGFNVKATNVQNAGAVGVVIANNVAGVANLGGVDPTVTIPVFLVSQVDGNTLRTNLASLNITLFNGGDTVAAFSSRGPGPRMRLKPDIAAPGYNIVSAQTGTTCTGTAPSTGCQIANPSGFLANSPTLSLNGTSMATPHVAGVMALLRQLHPDWSVEQLKALAMNTATHDVTIFPDGNGARHGAGRTGAGRVDASNAAQSGVVAFNATDAGAVSVSFETNYVVGTATEVKRVRIVNNGGAPATYDLGVDSVVDAPGISFSLPGGASVTVPAHSSVEIDVQMAADAALMDHAREATVAGVQAAAGTLAAAAGTQNRHWLTEETAFVTLSQGASLKLRVPLYATARPASAMAASGTIDTGGNPTGSTTLPLTGTGVCTGTPGGSTCTGTFNAPPFDVASLVTALQLQVISPRSPLIPASADIQYGGVAFDSIANRMMFGVSMWGPWTSPSNTTLNVYIDNNNDGNWDSILFDGNTGTHNNYLFGNSVDPQDTFISLRINLATNGVTIPSVATGRYVNGDPAVKDSALFNSSVKVLSASPATLGITGPFHYKLVTCPGNQLLCQRFNGFQFDEEAGPPAAPPTPGGFLFDTANQGLNFSGTSLAPDLPGATIPVTWNVANLTAQGSPGALLLHHHNRPEAQAEFVPLAGTVTTDLSIALSSTPSSPAVGSNVTLTVTVSNLGSNDATGVVASVELPNGLTYGSDDGGGSFNPGTAQWTIGALAASATATLQITATVETTDAQVVTAFVSAASPLETVLGNNTTTHNITAPRNADLATTIATGTASVVARNPVTFTATVTNNGDDPAFNVTVALNIESGAAVRGAGTPSAGTYNPATGAWTLSTLGTGTTHTISFEVTPLGAPELTMAATAVSGTGDLDTANNTALSTSVTVLTRPTVTTPTIASSVIAGELTPLTVTVVDAEVTGTPQSPSGLVTFASSIPADTFVGTCALAAGTAGTSSCQVNARFDSAGARTITASYVGTATHTASSATASSTATCSFDVTPGTLSFGAAEGSSTASVATASGCTWTGSSDAAFAQVTAGATGIGSGMVTYQVAVNPAATTRTATLTIAGHAFTLTQAGATCTYSLDPASASFLSAGGNGSVTVTTPAGCPVTAVSNAPFLQVTSVGSAPSAVVAYSVAPNPPPGSGRSGMLTIEGQTFTVTQTGVPTITPDRTSLTFGAINDGGSLTVATGAQAVSVQVSQGDPVAWTATADQPWIQLTQPAGMGSGLFSVGVVSAPGLPVSGMLTGIVTVNAPGASNAPRTIAVRMTLIAAPDADEPFGWIDTPAEGTTGVQGGLIVTGWALDDIEVTHVWIFRDPVAGEPDGMPVFLGEALFIPDARPDVETGTPAVPLNYRAGWGMVLLTNTLPGGGNGSFTLRAFAQDADGHFTSLGTRSFTASNNSSSRPFGTLDTPRPGETVSGTYINFGWALTPLPSTIPLDGSTISVFIDGVFRGHPSYNHARPDIVALFPGLNNSAGPVGWFMFDSRTLTNGLHTIAWVVQDDSGAVSGIGSRFFRVQNADNSSTMTVDAAATSAGLEASVASVGLRPGELGLRRGFDGNAPIRRVRAKGDLYAVAVAALERIELHLGGESDSGLVAGYAIVGNERRDLPAGSTLDQQRGVFYWQPGAAFMGRYELVFVRGTEETRVVVDVK